MNQISRISSSHKKKKKKEKKNRLQIWDDGLRKNHNLKQEKSGVLGVGGWIDFLFFENIIYIFLRDSLLNVFVYCFLFLRNSFMRCSPPWKQNEGHSQRSNCRKHHNHVLSSYHYWRCMWLRLSVCEWVFVRIHQGVIWNYFWQRRSISIAIFFGTEKKKKDRPVPLWLICSSPRASLPFHIDLNKSVLLWNRHIVYIQLLLRVVVNRGGLGREPEMEQGLAPSRLWYGTSIQTTLAGRKKSKSWNKFNICKNKRPVCSAFLSQPVWCSAQQKTSWSSQWLLCQTVWDTT